MVFAYIYFCLAAATAAPAACRYDFADWLSSRVNMQLSNEAGQSQVSGDVVLCGKAPVACVDYCLHVQSSIDCQDCPGGASAMFMFFLLCCLHCCR